MSGANTRRVWLAMLVAIVVAAVVSHKWGAKSLDPAFLILFLAVLALAIDGVWEWLSQVSNVKLPGGLEVTRAVEDAVAEAGALPEVDEEEEKEGNDKLRVLPPTWRESPAAGLAKLRVALDDRLAWLSKELYGKESRRSLATIERLREDRFIRAYEARIALAVRDVSGKSLARTVDRGGDRGEAAVRFMERADRAIYQIRLIAFDVKVRQGLTERELRILDIHGQPKGRWPDFYVFDPRAKVGRAPLRVSVRMARTKGSNLIDGTRKRLRNPKKWPETPFDSEVENVIVFPDTSATEPSEHEIPAFKRTDFLAWIDETWRTGQARS